MRRVLVPLDGSALAAAILPDARELAGEGGELILIGDPFGSTSGGGPTHLNEGESVRETLADLEAQADRLRQQGLTVETHALVMIDAAYAIDAAIRLYHADLVACSTHGEGPLGRLIHGGIAWRAIADSTVPVLVRHADEASRDRAIVPRDRSIMVPLDGSSFAEKALPLAQELAHAWNASILLTHVVSSYPITELPRTEIDPKASTDEQAGLAARTYLEKVAARLSGTVHTNVLFGAVSESLVTAVRTSNVGHVVMTSHGRTGLVRVLLGSIADDLIQHLDCPIVVIPVHAIEAAELSGEAREIEAVEFK